MVGHKEDFFGKDGFEDIFQSGLFGKEDFFENFENLVKGFKKSSVRKSPQEVRDEALIETFRQEAAKGDEEYLKKALVDYSDEVLREDPNEVLVKTYILAALTIENLDLAGLGFKFLSKRQPSDSELEGLVQFNRGFNSVAVSLFKNAGTISSKSRIAYSAALQNQGDLDLRTHFSLLNPLTEKVSLANTLFGRVCYNLGKYELAETSFKKAKDLKQSERTFLDHLRAQNKLGMSVYGELNSFYITTGSVLGSEQIITELNLDEISVPSFKVSGLGKMAVSLWSSK